MHQQALQFLIFLLQFARRQDNGITACVCCIPLLLAGGLDQVNGPGPRQLEVFHARPQLLEKCAYLFNVCLVPVKNLGAHVFQEFRLPHNTSHLQARGAIKRAEGFHEIIRLTQEIRAGFAG